MRTRIKTLRTSQVTVKTKTVVKNYGNGQIAEFTDVPDFEGPRVHLPGANSPEFWEKNPNSGYRKQMEMASKELYRQCTDNPKLCEEHNLTSSDLDNLQAGKTPEGRTWHHDHSPKNDCDMVLVDEKVHKKNPHCGSSLTSNNDKMKARLSKPASKLEEMKNTADYYVHKYKMTTSIASGVAVAGTTSALYYWGCKKLGRKPSGWGYAACAVIGGITSALVHGKLNDGKIYL